MVLEHLSYVPLVKCSFFSIFASEAGWQSRLAGFFFKFAAASNSTPSMRTAPACAWAGAGSSRRGRWSASAGAALNTEGRRVDKGVPTSSVADGVSEVEGGVDDYSELSGGPDFSAKGGWVRRPRLSLLRLS